MRLPDHEGRGRVRRWTSSVKAPDRPAGDGARRTRRRTPSSTRRRQVEVTDLRRHDGPRDRPRALFDALRPGGGGPRRRRRHSPPASKELRSRLPPLQIGKHGSLREWIEDYDEAEPGHRHMSHLLGPLPAGRRSRRAARPELLRGRPQRTLDRRLAHGGGQTGWSRAWIVNFYARLARRRRGLREPARPSCAGPRCRTSSTPTRRSRSTGTSAARPASPRCSSSPTAASSRLLPALPAAWAEGRSRGLCARGGFELDAVWTGSRVIELRVLLEEREAGSGSSIPSAAARSASPARTRPRRCPGRG
ncbi:MAG: hypothetical protein MZV64_22960 [Ignavibacteriales bacterium]|nr:hypothetical protein [Ignavibacteriales bacterium]